MFPFGTKDYVDFRGYLIERCPSCGTTGVFSLYAASRKLTVYLVPALTYGQPREILECRTCQAKFTVPDDLRASLGARLMSQEQLAARVRQLQSGASPVVSNGRTYYQVLQVDPAADMEVVEAAFKRLALKYHPDRSVLPEAAARMRDLIEAHEVLTDGRKRQAYDRTLGIERRPDALRPEDV